MKKFLARHSDKITGVLSGFDRILVRGTLRQLARAAGASSYLAYRGVLLKEFSDYAESITAQIRVRAAQMVLNPTQIRGRKVRQIRSGWWCGSRSNPLSPGW
jgi:hypothetical protein